MKAPTILVVDDDPDIRSVVSAALAEEGFEVASASNGQEALRLLRGRGPRPDLILLDMMMPVMDGHAFCAEQQKAPDLASIRVLLFSAYALPIATIRELHVAGVLHKPLRLAELLDEVEQAISR